MQSRPALSISLYVRELPCVVVGSGEAANERVGRLTRAGARVRQLAAEEVSEETLAGASVIIVMDDDAVERVLATPRDSGTLFYAHDRPDVSDFALPALAQHRYLSVAISTDALAPALARRLRIEWSRVLSEAGERFDRFLDRIAELRQELPAGQRGRLGEMAKRVGLGDLTIADSQDDDVCE